MRILLAPIVSLLALSGCGGDELLNAQFTSQIVQLETCRTVGTVRGNADSVATASTQIAQGNLDLSSRSAMLHAAVRWTWLGADWSLGRGWREAVFEDTLFPNEPVRTDHTVMTDLGAQWPLSDKHAIRVEYNQTRNTSSTRLFDNRYEQLSVTFRSVW